jgi:hypothetical protein
VTVVETETAKEELRRRDREDFEENASATSAQLQARLIVSARHLLVLAAFVLKEPTFQISSM